MNSKRVYDRILQMMIYYHYRLAILAKFLFALTMFCTCNKQNTNYKRKDVFYIFLCKISAPPPTCDHTLLNNRIISWMVRILTSYMILNIVSGYYMYVIRGRNIAFSNVQKRESRLIVCFQFKSNKQNVAGRDFFFHINISIFFFWEIIPVRGYLRFTILIVKKVFIKGEDKKCRNIFRL